MGTAISMDRFDYQPDQGSVHAQEKAFLFNQFNLSQYQHSMTQALALLEKRIETVEKPFSGVLPQELVGQFQAINLDESLSPEDALKELESIYLEHAIYFHHPRYVAHLNCPIVYPALVAELILSTVNSSLDTWDQSAGGTFIEQKLIDWTAEKIGFSAQADGVFTSGGTQSNLMAMLLARDSYCEKHLNGYSIKHQGLPPEARKFRIFTSELSHFSIQKSAAMLGLGYDAVIPVPCDEAFKLDVGRLQVLIEQTLQEGNLPIAVVATTGTTDFGSIDPVAELAPICQAHGMWLHADAAYGCGLLTSNKYRHLLSGIEQADSVTVDYHKSFFQPVSCGAFFVKDKINLSYVTHHAEYLNPLSATEEGTPNLVNKSIQTTRRFDALKLWLTLRYMGVETLGMMFDSVINLAQKTYAHLQTTDRIEALNRPSISTVIFRYVPDTDVPADLVDQANEYIRKAIFRSGEATIASTKFENTRYLKFTLLNPETSGEDIQFIVDRIVHYGDEFIANHFNEFSMISEAS